MHIEREVLIEALGKMYQAGRAHQAAERVSRNALGLRNYYRDRDTQLQAEVFLSLGLTASVEAAHALLDDEFSEEGAR